MVGLLAVPVRWVVDSLCESIRYVVDSLRESSFVDRGLSGWERGGDWRSLRGCASSLLRVKPSQLGHG